MSLRKRFGTSQDAIEKGAWIEVMENEDGSTMRIRVMRMNQQTPAFQKQMANHRKAFETDHFSGKMVEQAQASMIEILVDTIIVGWENVEDWTAEPPAEGFPPPEGMKFLEFNKTNVRKTLIEFPDLVDLIVREAQDRSTFSTAADLGN